jgi:hypothetical protein
MELHLAAISAKVAPGRHAALLLDQAGWHMSDRLAVPSNITIVVTAHPRVQMGRMIACPSSAARSALNAVSPCRRPVAITLAAAA